MMAVCEAGMDASTRQETTLAYIRVNLEAENMLQAEPGLDR